jgi:hypothetical protein
MPAYGHQWRAPCKPRDFLRINTERRLGSRHVISWGKRSTAQKGFTRQPFGCVLQRRFCAPEFALVPAVEDSMNLTALIIQLIAGALGGNAAGNLSKDINLGPLGNSIAGAIGGGVGGQVLNALLGLTGTAAASGLDIGSIVSAFVTGGVSGGLTALIVGFLKAKMAS